MQHIDDFACEYVIDGSTARVKISGTAGMAALDELNKAMAEIIAAQPEDVIFDLKELDFLGSLAIGAMVSCAISVRKRHGEARIINPRPEVADVLIRCRLDHLFDMR